GIRDRNVTGVQTCALPIWKNDGTPITHTSRRSTFAGRKGYFIFGIISTSAASMAVNSVFIRYSEDEFLMLFITRLPSATILGIEIGRASCRERVEIRMRAG